MADHCLLEDSLVGQWQQMIHDIIRVIPKEVDILTDQEVVVEIEDQSSIIEMSQSGTRVFSLGRSIRSW